MPDKCLYVNIASEKGGVHSATEYVLKVDKTGGLTASLVASCYQEAHTVFSQLLENGSRNVIVRTEFFGFPGMMPESYRS